MGDLCQNNQFLHAILGCDTTSRVFGIGKGVSLKNFRTEKNFRKSAYVFNGDTCSKKEVIQALVSLYNGKAGETIESLSE